LLASDTVSNIDGWSGNQSLNAMRCVGILSLHNVAEGKIWW
jgi:hypothetical protein